MKLAAQSEDPNSRMDKNPVKPRARRVKTSDNAGATNKRVCKGKMQSAEGVMEAEGPRPGFETLPPRSRSTSLDSIGSVSLFLTRGFRRIMLMSNRPTPCTIVWNTLRLF